MHKVMQLIIMECLTWGSLLGVDVATFLLASWKQKVNKIFLLKNNFELNNLLWASITIQ